MKNQFKKLSLILLLLISTQLLIAQTQKTPLPKIPDMLENADYVFEGTVVDAHGYWTKNDRGMDDIYTSLLVKVTNIFKGNGMKLGLVQIIVRGGTAPMPNDKELMLESPFFYDDDVKIPKFTQTGNEGIIAGKIIPNSKGYEWNVKLENTFALEETEAIIYCEFCWDYKYFAPWAGDFGNAKDLRKSIRSFNLQTDFIDRTDIVEDSIAKIQLEKDIKAQQEANLQMSKTVEEAKAREALMIQGKELAKKEEEAKKKANPNLKLAAGGNLNFDLRNIAYTTVSGQNYVDFDVYMWGTQATYFDGTLVRLNFDKQAFGDSTYVKSYLTTAKGTSFNNYNYKIYGPYYISDTVIAINLSTNDSLIRPNRIAVGTTPLQLMHVKFKIKSCQATAKMKFVDPVICDILTGYKLNSNDSISGTVYAYDNIFRTDYSPIPLCPTPKITGFSPSVIRAGTDEILTITGTGFGATRGKGQVLFPDADSIGRFMQGCDTSDYISWSNTEIKVKVPSAILNSNFRLNSTAGSGKYKVINDLGYRDSTTTQLDIQYSIANSKTIGTGIKRKNYWMMKDCNNNARTFVLGNEIIAKPQAVALIDSAINTWARFLRMDIRLLRDNDGNYIPFDDAAVNNLDSINVIYVENFSALASKPLMRTEPASTTCGNNIGRFSADIGVNMVDYTWHYGFSDSKPADSYDFYQAILHEIGHALCLQHVINPIPNGSFNADDGYGELMHPYNSSSTKSPSQRTTLETGRQMAKVGSVNIRDTSKAITWACSSIKKIREFSSPQNKTVCIGSSVAFSAFCEQPSGSPAPSYTWQHLNNFGTWVNTTTSSLSTTVTGQVTATLTIASAPSSLNGKPFRCKISNIDGCTVFTQPAILKFNTPTFFINPVNLTVNENNSFSLFVQSDDSTLQYKWQHKLAGSSVYNDINDGTQFSNTATSTLATYNTPYSFDQSYFRCKGTNTDGCVGYSSAAKITVNPTGFAPTNPTNNKISSNLKVVVFPNPSTNSISINLDDPKLITSIIVLNSNGNIIFSNKYNYNPYTLDISNYPTGLYILKISDGDSEITKEIVITH